MTTKMAAALELRKIYDKIKDKELNIKVAYNFNKIMRKVEEELQFYSSELNKILDEYCQKDENGERVFENGNFKIIPDKTTECTEKINNLLSLDIDLPDVSFSLEDFDDMKLEISEVGSLVPFIKED